MCLCTWPKKGHFGLNNGKWGKLSGEVYHKLLMWGWHCPSVNSAALCVWVCVWVSVTGALWRVYECVPETAVINCLLWFIINKKHESTVEEGVNKVSSPSVDGGLTSDLELNKSLLGSSTPVWGLKKKCHQHYGNTIIRWNIHSSEITLIWFRGK